VLAGHDEVPRVAGFRHRPASIPPLASTCSQRSPGRSPLSRC
jgi:hypothetical protein